MPRILKFAIATILSSIFSFIFLTLSYFIIFIAVEFLLHGTDTPFYGWNILGLVFIIIDLAIQAGIAYGIASGSKGKDWRPDFFLYLLSIAVGTLLLFGTGYLIGKIPDINQADIICTADGCKNTSPRLRINN